MAIETGCHLGGLPGWSGRPVQAAGIDCKATRSETSVNVIQLFASHYPLTCFHKQYWLAKLSVCIQTATLRTTNANEPVLLHRFLGRSLSHAVTPANLSPLINLECYLYASLIYIVIFENENKNKNKDYVSRRLYGRLTEINRKSSSEQKRRS